MEQKDDVKNQELNPEETKAENTSAEIVLTDEQKKINELEEKLKELNDKYMRQYSEFENYKKRTSRERVELIRSAGEEVFKILLPLMDDFERAMKANETATEIKPVTEGVNLIYQKLRTTFAARGLEEMKCLGEEFNPDLHEAITNVPATSEELKGKIVEVMEKGYMLNGKVIRFAKVIVGN